MKKRFSLGTLIAAMKPGIRYTAPELAAMTEMPLSTIRSLLGSDPAITRLDVKTMKSARRYSIAGTCGGPARLDTRIGPDLTSTLAGYQQSLEVRASLAMLVRRCG
ncbi:hypothetical protein KY49_705 [Burkholderia sp. MSHR3999]|uniref:hypothetical protein n=1 Tax=Burkholderia sp. MSHR3999 TaxID=1542965 RepID=UPI0005AC83FF|nr:hypothetical protein [Burkholderia sp. MSHR3999]KIP14097.1 hypothetical protein KY49_705 [Burkholderia sp. MSHR3999]